MIINVTVPLLRLSAATAALLLCLGVVSRGGSTPLPFLAGGKLSSGPADSENGTVQ